MKPTCRLLAASLACLAPVFAADLKSGPALPHHVADWPQMPKGMNFGECSGVDVDKNDNVWVFNRGTHPVMEFDRGGKLLQAWTQEAFPVKSSHGIRVGPDGNIWCVDVKGHVVFKLTPAGRVVMVLGNRQGTPGNNDSQYAFNEPTGVAFAANGDFFVSDGYVNSRVIKFTPDGEHITHWGKKGNADGEITLSHDVCVDKRGRVYVADRSNSRIQIFDGNGKFLGKWIDVGQPWGLYYVGREDAIYMSDGLNNRIVKLNLDGQILGVLSSFGKAPGKLDFAHNLSVDSQGSIYVAEIKNWRVQKFAR